MLVFATSDKGGTGRSVTSSNVAYRRAVRGEDVCYLDFDFGSPTAGAVFQVEAVSGGTATGGLHSYVRGETGEPEQRDVWTESDLESLRNRDPGSGRLVLLPGDVAGGEFPTTPEMTERCVRLFLRLEEEFGLSIVDLSAGRSYAVEMALQATRSPQMRHVTTRWLVFHRWTRQHIMAAGGFVDGPRGIVESGVRIGHDRAALRNAIRFVRTAVIDLRAPGLRLRPAQATWLEESDRRLHDLAATRRLGQSTLLGTVPLDPVLQWREQVLSNADVDHGIANQATVAAYDTLARKLLNDEEWEGL